tara:strand:- start:1164 stop:2306 length:1143 start_codon:yes stop_codon:yes gene_type:complete
MKKIKVQILDSTLREGEQTPGVSFNISQKIEIVKLLNEFGVDYIEIGHPAVSKDIYSFIEKVSNLKLKSKIIAHSRLLKKDIDQVIELNIPWIGLFFDVCEDHFEKKYGVNEKKALEMITDSVSYSKKHNLNVRFTAEDASRTNFEVLIKFAKLIEKAGADRFSFADTVGILHPAKVKDIFSRLSTELKIPIHGHFHNDFGLATANALQALQSGASCVDVTINNLGERCGISSLAEVVTSLDELFNVKNSWKFKILNDISSYVNEISNITYNDIRPITGKNAFTHNGGLHVSSVIKDESFYEPMDPEKFNRKRHYVIDKFSGKDALSYRLRKLNIDIPEKDLSKLLVVIKSKPEINRWTDEKLILLFNQLNKKSTFDVVK